jgi:hypothetical protein
MITKEIMKGRHGAGVLMMDAGRLEKRQQAGIQTGTHLPDSLLPQDMAPEERQRLQRTLKPDALLRIRHAGGRPDTIVVVEVKYCKDARRDEQEARAEAQHAKLLDVLRQAGHDATQTTILLGVGGTIYKNTPEDLAELGVDRDRAARLLENLSMYAVNQMHSIVCMKRAKESGVRTPGQHYSGKKGKKRKWGET